MCVCADLQELVGRVAGLEARLGGSTAAPTSASTATAGGEEDEDFDLFGSDGVGVGGASRYRYVEDTSCLPVYRRRRRR